MTRPTDPVAPASHPSAPLSEHTLPGRERPRRANGAGRRVALSLPSLGTLDSLSVTTRPPNARWDLAAPIALSIPVEAGPRLRRIEIHGPVAALGALPAPLEHLAFELGAQFALERDEKVPSVRELALESRAGAHDLALLARFPGLRRLSLSGPGFRSLDALAACPELERLSLHELTDATDVSYLRTPRPFELVGGRVVEALGLGLR